MKILMIEDDKTTLEVIRLTLEVQDPNSRIISKENGRDGLESARNERFDVVVLDLGLPDIDGMKVLEELRGFSQVPVLVVSARHDPEVITNALDLGAQDYILKPFQFQSFLTSLKDVTTPSPAKENLKNDGRLTEDLTIYSDTHKALVKGNRVELTTGEWKILNKLIEHCGRIVPVKTLAETLCEEKFVSEPTVHLMIGSLRKKLGDDPYLPRIIISEYDCGYRFIRPNVLGNPAGKQKPYLNIVS